MAEHPGVRRFGEYLDAFRRFDREAMRDFFTDDVMWHVDGNHEHAGDYKGKDRLFEYFDRAASETDSSLRLELESVLANDQYVAAFVRVSGRRHGNELDVLMHQMFTVAPDGRWREFWALAADQDSVDAFWS